MIVENEEALPRSIVVFDWEVKDHDEVLEHLIELLELTETATDEVFTNKDKTIGIELVESTIKIYFAEKVVDND